MRFISFNQFIGIIRYPLYLIFGHLIIAMLRALNKINLIRALIKTRVVSVI